MNISLYNSVGNTVGMTSVPKLITCDHIRVSITTVFRRVGIQSTFMTIFEINHTLRQIFKNKSNHLFGIYPSKKQWQNSGRPVLVVDTSFKAYTMMYRYGKWFCSRCTRLAGGCVCKHAAYVIFLAKSEVVQEQLQILLQTKDISSNNIETQLRDIRNRRQAAVALEFELNYVFPHPKHMICAPPATGIPALRGLGLDLWLCSVYVYDFQQNLYKVYPEATNCVNCGSVLNILGSPRRGFFCGHTIRSVDVYKAACTINPSCSMYRKAISYHGALHHVVNHDNFLIYAIENIERPLRYYRVSDLASSAWWSIELAYYQSLSSNSITQGLVETLKEKRSDISKLLAGAAELCHFNHSFKCCAAPQIVSCDGIAMSVAHDRLPQFQFPWRNPDVVCARATKRQDRQLPPLTDEETDAFAAFCSPDGLSSYALKNIQGKSTSTAVCLVLSCGTVHSTKKSHLICPLALQPFVQFLRKPVSAINTLISFKTMLIVEDAVNSFVDASDVQSISNVMSLSSMIAEFLLEIQRTPFGVLRTHKHNLLKIFVLEVKAMLNRIFDPNLGVGCYNELTSQEQQSIKEVYCYRHPIASDINELWSTGAYFPGFPIVRSVKHIDISKKKRRKMSKKIFEQKASCSGSCFILLCRTSGMYWL